MRRSKNWPNVGVETHAPEANSSHELFSAFELTVATEDGINELTSAVFAHGDLLRVAALLLGGLPHVVFADFEELVETLPEPFPRVEEFVDQIARLGLADARHGVFSTLDLASKLDQKKPKFASNLGDWRCRAEEEYGPVVDPFSE